MACILGSLGLLSPLGPPRVPLFSFPEVSKDGASFQVAGDIGKGNLCIQSNTSADKPSDRVEITMEEPTKQTYAMRYLTFFTKAAPLSDTVTISLSPD